MIEKLKDKHTRSDLIDALCQGITNTSDFKDALEYIIDSKLYMFDDDYFYSPIDDDENELVIDIILPTFRRVWASVYVKLPDKLDYNYNIDSKIINKRVQLYRSLFNIDDFLDYLKEMILKTKGCLSDFEYIDRTLEVVTLIADNYIAYLLKYISESDNIDRDIRDSKLKKLMT